MHPLRDLSLDALRRRTSIKWTMHPPDVLPMFVAEMDAHPIPAVVEAVERAVRDGDTGYPFGPVYAEAFAEIAADLWGWTVDVDATSPVADVMTGVAESLTLLTEPGDGVVVSPPVYPPFFDVVRHVGRRVVEAPLGPEGRLDLETLDRAFADATAYLLCSPINPTSVVHTRAELEALADLARRHDVRVVVDEIHAPLADGFVPYLTVDDSALVVVSASKAFNLAGFKAGLVAGGAAAPELKGIDELVSHGTSHLGVIAHVAAMRHGRDWLAGVRADLADNRRLLADLLASRLPGARWVRGDDGTYLAWLDLRGLDLGDDPAGRLLELGRVSLVPGVDFGEPGRGFARLNIGTTPELIGEAVDRMARTTEVA